MREGGIKMDILEVKNLSKVYGSGENKVHALKNVSFKVAKGGICCYRLVNLGPGKVLCGEIGGLDTPTSEKVLLMDEIYFSLKEKELTCI